MERQTPEEEADWPTEEEEEEGGDPNEPSHADYDLSEAAGYGARDYREGQTFPSQRLIVLFTVLLIFALAAPFIIRLLR